MTLAFEDANSKLFNVACVTDLDAEDSVEDSLVEVLNLDFEAESWSRFWGIFLAKTLMLTFGWALK